MIVTKPQLLMFTGIGAMKSFTSEVKEDDDRVFRKTLPKASQVPGGKTPAVVRLIAASPKVFATRLAGAFGGLVSVTVPVLIAPSESLEVRLMWLPQHGTLLPLAKHWLSGPLVTHRSRPKVGVPLPPKSYVTRTSPAVRLIVCAPGVPRPGVVAWLISKSMF